MVVADDDDDSLALLSSSLRRAGYEVIEAHDGEELCDRVARSNSAGARPAAVVSDIEMPACDGVSATRRLHELIPELPVVLVTAAHDEARLRDAHAAGAAAVLPKPVDRALMVALVNHRRLARPTS